MAETIITKQCSHCKQVKPISEFVKNRSQKDGIDNNCKSCKKNYYAEYRKSKTFKAYQSAYKKSEKYKSKQKKYRKIYDEECADKQRARSAVKYAVKTGKLKRPSDCICFLGTCNNMADEYHHHKGYAKKNRLTVIPVCKLCHAGIHNNTIQLSVV